MNEENNTQDSQPESSKYSSIRYEISDGMLIAEFSSDSLAHPLDEDTLSELVTCSTDNANLVTKIEVHHDASFDTSIRV